MPMRSKPNRGAGAGGARLPRCGVVMPVAKEPCARVAGHGYKHRSRWAMDNEYRARLGREVDPFVERGGEWVPR